MFAFFQVTSTATLHMLPYYADSFIQALNLSMILPLSYVPS